MNKTIAWDYYHSFLAVMQEGSLSAAARAIGSTQPTIGRHITELEHLLGTTLFIRNQIGFTPTEAAQSLVEYAQQMDSIASAMERLASNQGEGIQGSVRITTSDVMGIEVLPKILAEIGQDHPKLSLELMLSDKPQDLLNREADIAVRLFRPTQTQLIARRIGKIDIGFFAHQNYLQQHGTPTSINELQSHKLIGFDQLTDYIRSVEKKFPFKLDKNSFAFRTGSNIAQLALIRSAAGIGMCQVPLTKENGHLVRLLEKEFNFEMEAWVTMHEDLRRNPACQLVFNQLAAGLQDYINQ